MPLPALRTARHEGLASCRLVIPQKLTGQAFALAAGLDPQSETMPLGKSAALERVDQKTGSTIRTGKLVVNLDAQVVSVDDRPVLLSGKEYGILELLSLRKGTILTKEMFLNHLYGGMHEPELKIIDVFVCKLRKKLVQATGGSHYIETVWGRGYVLRDAAITLGTVAPGIDIEDIAEAPARTLPIG